MISQLDLRLPDLEGHSMVSRKMLSIRDLDTGLVGRRKGTKVRQHIIKEANLYHLWSPNKLCIC